MSQGEDLKELLEMKIAYTYQPMHARPVNMQNFVLGQLSALVTMTKLLDTNT